MYCKHPKLKSSARRDYCPDCKYEYYYGDAHAKNPEDRISKLINSGEDEIGILKSPEELPSFESLKEEYIDYY